MSSVSKIAACGLLAGLAGVVGLAHAQQNVEIVNEGGIRDKWMLADGTQLTAPGYPAQFVDRGDSVCLAMGYAIKPDGSTSDFSLIRSWNSSTGAAEPVEGFWNVFTQAGANALSQWKFKPRPEVAKPQPTYTVATLFFNGKDGIDNETLKGHCRIDYLKALVEENQAQGLSWAQRRELERMEQYSRRAMQENPGIRPRPRPTP